MSKIKEHDFIIKFYLIPFKTIIFSSLPLSLKKNGERNKVIFLNK